MGEVQKCFEKHKKLLGNGYTEESLSSSQCHTNICEVWNRLSQWRHFLHICAVIFVAFLFRIFYAAAKQQTTTGSDTDIIIRIIIFPWTQLCMAGKQPLIINPPGLCCTVCDVCAEMMCFDLNKNIDFGPNQVKWYFLGDFLPNKLYLATLGYEMKLCIKHSKWGLQSDRELIIMLVKKPMNSLSISFKYCCCSTEIWCLWIEIRLPTFICPSFPADNFINVHPCGLLNRFWGSLVTFESLFTVMLH